MKKRIQRLALPFVFASILTACNNAPSSQQGDGDANAIDTLQVITAFNELKNDTTFLYDLGLLTEGTYAFYDEERPLLIGDINRDSLPDALMPFSIEGMGGGNNYTAHYALLLNDNGRLVFNSVLNRGGKMAEHLITFTSITRGVIEGWKVPGMHEMEGDSVYVQYEYRNGKLEETVREN